MWELMPESTSKYSTVGRGGEVNVGVCVHDNTHIRKTNRLH